MEDINWNDSNRQAVNSACHFYGSWEERWKGVLQFIEWSAKNGTQVVILSNEHLDIIDSRIKELVQQTGSDLDHSTLIKLHPVPSGKSTVMDVLNSVIDSLGQVTQPVAEASRYLILDVHEIISKKEELKYWTSSFSFLEENCRRKNIRILCQYDTRALSQIEKNEFSSMHPLVFQGRAFHGNPFFRSPEFLTAENLMAAPYQNITIKQNHNTSGTNRVNQTDDYFRILYEQAPLPYQSLDVNGNILDVNTAWCELFQYSKDEVIGTWLGDYLIPAQKDLFRERFSQFKNCGKVSGVNFEIICKSGETVIISAEGRISTNPDGSFRQTHCILINITERILAERANHEREQIFKALYENNQEAILLIKPGSGLIVGANPAACEFYGYSFSEITQKTISDINILSDNEVLGEMNSAQAMEKNNFHFRHQLANNDTRVVEVISRPITINGEQLLYSTIHDITHEIKVEEEANRLKFAMHEKLIALAQPVDNVDHLQFEDLFNLEEIQDIQNAFAEATGVASIITDTEGRAITKPSNFCRLCNDIIRTNPIGLANCMKSDQKARIDANASKMIQPCISAGLLDIGAPIIVGEHHIANWMIGQVWDPEADQQQMMEYARLLGVDPGIYLDAMNEVPRIPPKKLEKISQTLFLIADQLSKLATQNIQQARTILERENANLKLQRVNHLYRVISTISQAAEIAKTPEQLFQLVCDVLVEQGRFDNAYLGILDNNKNSVIIMNRAGEFPGDVDGKVYNLYFPIQDCDPVAQSITENKIFFKNTIENSPDSLLWEKMASAKGYLSAACLPVVSSGEVIGVLGLFSSVAGFFDNEETKLLEEVSSTLTFSLDAMKVEEQRKKAELDLAASEKRYRCLFSGGSDAIYIYPLLENGIPGNFVEVNAVASQRMGYKPEELYKMSLYQINSPGSEESVSERFRKLAENQHILTEAIHVTRDGRNIPVEINSSLVDLNGHNYVFSISRDITERKQAEARIKNQIHRLSALHIIDNSIASKQPLPILMDAIIEQVQMQLNSVTVIILLYDIENEKFTQGFSKGLKQPGTEFMVGENIARNVIRQKQPIRIDNVFHDSRFLHKELMDEEASGFYSARIDLDTKTLGVLEVFHNDKITLDEDWKDYFSTLAGQIAIAIETHNLDDGLIKANQVLVQAYEETIEGWSRALDLRDHETEGHSRRVTDTSVKLAKLMGLSEEAIVSIRRGALLHDIGKVGVPDNILLKPGKLTEDEWVVMKKHPKNSYDLLSPIAFLQSSLDIPYCHHEKWDGTGYPQGLSGEGIPLAARIFAIVDVWDALRSDRPYRKGWSLEEINDYILSQSGKHFDPRVVEAFIKLEKYFPNG